MGTVAGPVCAALLRDCGSSGWGRVHIITTHPGMGGTPVRATASSRYSFGDRPTSSLKRALNEPRLAKPTRTQTSVTERFAVRRSVFARSIRRRVVRAGRFAVGRRERSGEVKPRVAGFAGHGVEVERLRVLAIDEIPSSP
jgi:hypothetical protein